MNANGNNRERWTDERLDRLADSVSELRESITATNVSVDSLRITAQALLQLAAQQQQVERERHEEMQQVQLEIRNINERLDVQQGQIRVLLERLLSGS
jgi:uncharacterized coiled-coil DUF342 family protein